MTKTDSFMLVAGCVAAYICGAIACLTIMPPLDTWAAFLVVGGFIALLGIVLEAFIAPTGAVLVGVATACWYVTAFTSPHVTTAGHWGIAAAVSFCVGCFGSLFLLIARDDLDGW